MKLLKWLKRLFKRKASGEKHVRGGIVSAAKVYKIRREIEDRKSQLSRVLSGAIEDRKKEIRIKDVARRQPASQTYTGRKIRGFKPQFAYTKRMWRLQISEDELDLEDS